MQDKKFDPGLLYKLNDPGRKKTLDPEILWGLLGLENPETLVDVGAGTGFFAALFADKMKKGRIYACDTSDDMISWMKENLEPSYRGRIVAVKSGETEIPLPDCTADGVYMINLHHELEDPAGLLKEAYRLLKPSGRIMDVDWKAEQSPEGPPVSIRLPAAVIAEQLEQAGFEEISYTSELPYHNAVIGSRS